jgi:cell division GTPase FtsZ
MEKAMESPMAEKRIEARGFSCAFVCLGQAGINLGGQMLGKGHKVMALNTSPKDLMLFPGDLKYPVKSGLQDPMEGAGKSRKAAKEALEDDIEGIVDWISANVDKEKFIFVVFSAGGGTGSGMGPGLIDVLAEHFQRKIVCAITMCPSQEESIVNLGNCLECLEELEQIEGMGATFIIDNNKQSLMESGDPDDQAEILDGMFVELLESCFDMTTRIHKRGIVDTADFSNALGRSGCAVIARCPGTVCTAKDLVDSLGAGPFLRIEDDKVVGCLVMDKSSPIKANHFVNAIGQYDVTFETHNSEATTLLAAGLSFPHSFMERTRAEIAAAESGIAEKRGAVAKSEFTGKAIVNLGKKAAHPAKQKKSSHKEMLGIYKRT